jgi:hypothetical protein
MRRRTPTKPQARQRQEPPQFAEVGNLHASPFRTTRRSESRNTVGQTSGVRANYLEIAPLGLNRSGFRQDAYPVGSVPDHVCGHASVDRSLNQVVRRGEGLWSELVDVRPTRARSASLLYQRLQSDYPDQNAAQVSRDARCPSP